VQAQVENLQVLVKPDKIGVESGDLQYNIPEELKIAYIWLCTIDNSRAYEPGQVRCCFNRGEHREVDWKRQWLCVLMMSAQGYTYVDNDYVGPLLQQGDQGGMSSRGGDLCV